MSSSEKLLIILSTVYSRVTSLWHKAGLDRDQQLWLGFILMMSIGLLMAAWPHLTLLSGILLVVLLVCTGWLAWSWQAMQLSIALLVLFGVLVLLSGKATQVFIYINFAMAALLLAGILLHVLMEAGKYRIAYKHVRLVYWSVVISGLLLLIIRWTTRTYTGLHYASLPLANSHDVLLLLVVCMFVMYLFFMRSQMYSSGAFMVLLPAILLGLYITVYFQLWHSWEQSLPSTVLEHGLILFHVPMMIAAFALLLNAAGFALLRLFADVNWFRQRQNRDVRETILISLEGYLYRFTALAIIILATGLLSGVLWSSLAWGHYWQWDAKLVLSMAVWLYYLAGLHLHLQKGLQGKAFAWWCVAGLPLILMTLLGTNYWPDGLHDFTGG